MRSVDSLGADPSARVVCSAPVILPRLVWLLERIEAYSKQRNQMISEMIDCIGSGAAYCFPSGDGVVVAFPVGTKIAIRDGLQAFSAEYD